MQQCVVHPIRNSFRFAGAATPRRHREALRPVHTAPQSRRRQAAVRRVRPSVERPVYGDRLAMGERAWRVRAVPRIRRGDPARDLYDERDREHQRPLPARGGRPRSLPQRGRRDKAPLSDSRSFDPTGCGRALWVVGWKPALNAFGITSAGRFERTTHQRPPGPAHRSPDPLLVVERVGCVPSTGETGAIPEAEDHRRTGCGSVYPARFPLSEATSLMGNRCWAFSDVIAVRALSSGSVARKRAMSSDRGIWNG